MFESSMGRHSRNQSTLLAAAAAVAVAVALFLSPARVQRTLRSAVLDVVTPGQAWVLVRYESGRRLGARTILAVDVRRTARRVDDCARDRLRGSPRWSRPVVSLRLENARLREELQPGGKIRRVARAVPGSKFARRCDRRAGRRHQPRGTIGPPPSSSWAPAARRESRNPTWFSTKQRPRLDQGSEAGVEPELDVLIGRCVVGRIASVGHWTSALEPITDPRYRGLAQIIRPSDQGGSFGAEGILVGQGTELLQVDRRSDDAVGARGRRSLHQRSRSAVSDSALLRPGRAGRGGRSQLGHFGAPGCAHRRSENCRGAQIQSASGKDLG